MKVIETNTETMQNDVRSVETMIGQLSGDLRNLASCAESQLAELEELIKTVQDLNRGTDSARGRYVDCEANVASIISSIEV